MIYGIGVDIVEIARVEKLYTDFGERFTRRILTLPEREEFARRGLKISYLATRFAAKEAVAKALGTGIGEALGFHSVQIVNSEQGRPEIRFLDTAVSMIAELNIGKSFLSLSDEKHYAVAMVVLES